MQTLDELPNVTQLFLDVTDLGSIRGAKILIEEETGGRLDVLVNNARVYSFHSVHFYLSVYACTTDVVFVLSGIGTLIRKTTSAPYS